VPWLWERLGCAWLELELAITDRTIQLPEHPPECCMDSCSVPPVRPPPSYTIESQNGLGWNGPYRSSRSNPSALGRDPFHQTRLLRAPSNLALNTAKEGAATASLGNLGQGLNTFIVKNFFLRSNLNLPSFSLKSLLVVLSLLALVKSPSPYQGASFFHSQKINVVVSSPHIIILLINIKLLIIKY